jgi:hypothetical protein
LAFEDDGGLHIVLCAMRDEFGEGPLRVEMFAELDGDVAGAGE